MPGVVQLKWYGPWQRVFAQGMPRRWSRLLERWLVKQRWYLEKDATLLNLKLQDAWTMKVEGQTVWWLMLECITTSGCKVYQVPWVLLPTYYAFMSEPIALLTGAEEGFVVDAWTWMRFAHGVLQQLAGTMQIEKLASWHDEEIDGDLLAEVLPPMFSNTGIRFGDRYFMKVQRQVVAGMQPDEEMCRELSRRGSRHTIPLIAGVQYRANENAATLATLSHYTPNEDNGWLWLFKQVMAADTGKPQQIESLLQAVSLLAQRTAELHRLLAVPSDDPAFAPEPWGQEDVDALLARVQLRVEHVSSLLRKHRRKLKHVSQLIDTWFAIESDSGEANRPKLTVPMMKQRIHGDYHLGQVLRTEADWLIIDFEGEPLRPLQERRDKDSPVRDVAGMVRSFHYAQAVAIQRKPESEAAIRNLFAVLISSFLESYSTHCEGSVLESMKPLLPLYLLEKALYEVEYEIRSRPEWVGIPLGGAIELMQSGK